MKAHGLPPNVVQISMAVSRLGRMRRGWQSAVQLLESAEARYGVTPNTITYNAAISACEKGGQWERALALLDAMQAAGVAPDTITYSAAISACEKGGQWERALALLDEMQAAGVAPNTITYNATISACEKGGQWERALSLLD